MHEPKTARLMFKNRHYRAYFSLDIFYILELSTSHCVIWILLLVCETWIIHRLMCMFKFQCCWILSFIN